MDIISGFATLFGDPFVLMFVALGVILGVFAGALPGMTASAAIALLVPVTFFLPPLASLTFLYVIGKAARYGGSIAAILFNTPGTAASAATMIDGYPLTRQGRAGAAIRISTTASATGDLIGDLVLIFGGVFIAGYTEQLGPPEFFSVYVMAFIVIGSVVGRSVVKGLISTALGIMAALIGLDPISGEARWTFGILEFEDGLSLVPLLIGLFVLSEVFTQASEKTDSEVPAAESKSDARAGRTISKEEWKLSVPVIFRSSIIGSCIGLLPGLGSAVACFVAYGEEKRRAKRPELWGKGAIEGVAAPEAANNAVSGPSMVPLLALGVPGSTIAAVLMGVFLIHGIQVGPNIFTTNHDIVFGLFAAGLLGILGYALVGLFFGPLIGRIIGLAKPKYIYPFIFVFAFVGSYAGRLSLTDVMIMMLFGVVGFVMKKLDYSPAAFIIAFVLGRGAEESLRQSLMLDNSGALIFFDRPVALIFFAIAFCAFTWRVYRLHVSAKKDAAPSLEE